MNAPETKAGMFVLEMARHIRAPREKVFDAFVSGAALATWMGPRGMSVPESSADPRVGGRWRVVMLSRDGSRLAVGGEYREISRPGRIAFTWKWEGGGPMLAIETLVEVSFEAKDGGTELRLKHSGFPDADRRDGHGLGWGSTLNKLVGLLDERGQAAVVTLLGDARSSYVRTARMALSEKGVAYKHEGVPPHSPEILAVNPFGKVPAFRDGEVALFETSAIVRYIDEGFDGPPLLPMGLTGRAKCEQWVSAVKDSCYDAMVRRYVLQYIFPKGPDGKPDRAVIEGALKQIPAQLAALDKAYGSGDYLAGPSLSSADLFLAPILFYLEQFPEGKSLLAAAPNVQRAQDVIRNRASFKETQP
jgi:glutathione S-transferase